jgi:hypothetical protein
MDDLGPHETTFFDPTGEVWSEGPLMSQGRYYPTATVLGDGRVFVSGGTTTCGTCYANRPEIYDPVADTFTPLAPTAQRDFKYYPHPYLLPDGRIIVAAQDDKAIDTRVLDLATQQWTVVDSRIIDGHSSVMYLPGKFMKSGKATADMQGYPAVATTFTLDMNQPSPQWQATAPMAYPRSFHNLTLLPDGQVLVTGGGTTTNKVDYANAVHAAELWSPVTRTWTTLASSHKPRMYHSTALLLPDATVLVAGSGRQNGRSQPDPAESAKRRDLLAPVPVPRPAPDHLLRARGPLLRKRLHGRDAERGPDRLGGAPRSGIRHPRVQPEPTLRPARVPPHRGRRRAVGPGSRARKPRATPVPTCSSS